jgi:hypothetical protein
MKNYEITKEQIKQLAKGNAKVKEWFPEVFETKLEIGKWYKHESSNMLFFPLEIKDENSIRAYGFTMRGNFSSDNGLFEWGNPKAIRLATDSEVLEALKKEAIKRGFVKGAYFKELWAKSNCKVNDIVYKHFTLDLRSNGKCLFHNGKWAEIIKTYTKEEAEKLLNAKII